MWRVYIAASTQRSNVGIGQYGTEQDRMHFLADRIAFFLKQQRGTFEVFRNSKDWSLEQTVKDCNSVACQLFIDNHTNAGQPYADGTEVYYHNGSTNGKRLADNLFAEIAPLSPGTDQGVLSDSVLYQTGLYVLKNTHPPAALIEHIYHTNAVEVDHFLANVDAYAKATCRGICKYFDVKFIEPAPDKDEIALLLQRLEASGATTSISYWNRVLRGLEPVNPKYLQMLIANLLNLRK